MTTRYLPAQRAQPEPPGRTPSRDAALAWLASRLTERDRLLIRTLWEHHVLTTHQITELAYGSPSRARHRMLRLHRAGVVDRFRPLQPIGSAPLHYVIGENGARVLAAERDTSLAELGYRRDRVLAIAYSQRLPHTVGVNGIFTALAATARRHRAARLLEWWPERRCQDMWGAFARPDGYGKWQENGAECDFFIEYDTGTETLHKVSRKLDGYAELVAATNIATPVLIWTSSRSREANLHRELTGAPVPVATTTPQAISRAGDWGPAGPAWLPVQPGGAAHNPCMRLTEISGPGRDAVPALDDPGLDQEDIDDADE
jgi:Replication-relaxation